MIGSESRPAVVKQTKTSGVASRMQIFKPASGEPGIINITSVSVLCRPLMM
jgi:hypothetical protein